MGQATLSCFKRIGDSTRESARMANETRSGHEKPPLSFIGRQRSLKSSLTPLPRQFVTNAIEG